MIQAGELLGILYCHHVLDILYHTDSGTVTTVVGTDRTDVLVADVMADLAEFHFFLHPADGIGKLKHIIGILTQEVEHQSQGGLASDARQLGELLYCPLQ